MKYGSLLSRVRQLASYLRVLHARATGAMIAPTCSVAAGCDLALGSEFSRTGKLALGERTTLDTGVILRPYGGSIVTDIDVYLGPHTIVYGHGGVTIGKDTLISMHCRILSSNHTIPLGLTIIRSQPDRCSATHIGADVWLGAGVTVLGGVTIGDRCVVGAGSVVTHDLPAGSIAIGTPAAVYRTRA